MPQGGRRRERSEDGGTARPRAVVFILFILVFSLFQRYKRCPSDKILVVYGKVGKGTEGNLSAKCIHGGAAFIWPVIQDYSFLDLTPMSIEVNLTNALSKQNIRVDVPSRFTVGISTEPAVMQNAAERLLGMQRPAPGRGAGAAHFFKRRIQDLLSLPLDHWRRKSDPIVPDPVDPFTYYASFNA